MWRALLFFLLLWGCNPSSSEDFQAESQIKCAQLAALLRKVECFEDLLKIENTLTKKFNEIAKLMIAAHHFQEKHPGAIYALSNPNSDLLLEELKKVYAIKGGRELIERAQNNAYGLLRETEL